ncbi:MAG TPA: putative glycoside hydrolase [Labilithrix sp.]|nr:putative glycoside hydrolase [Labilithrix sp.]
MHAVSSGETWQSIAEAYLELTREYDARDLAKAIVDDNGPESKAGPTPGLRVRIPRMLEAAPKTGAAERIGLPRDGVVRGIYVRGSTAGSRKFPALLDRIVAHGMNAIVLDVKDYDGALTYPSKVELAVESGATDAAPIPSYARAVRFAHLRGVRVIARISCFSDQRMAKSHPSMAIRGVSGHPYRNGWLDPRNERAQAYVIDLVKEAIAAGVDEIQLDYVRFPVVGMKNIDFGVESHKDPNAKVKTITSFVERVHAITRAHGLPLSLDVFGVIAFGKQVDIQNLGQDPVELAKHSEFLSVMVYPSHYDPGFMGLDAPGDHPELVGMGVKHMREEMEERGLDLETSAKIRPWLQAMRHKSSNYGPGYIQHEIRSGEKAGASGWLLWNPGQVYDVAFRAVPRQPKVTKPPPLAPIKNR